ncbi:hypothetical protein [Actinomadura geliboluensis]|uniref:hypothetical protein n=1 Tax=Actinomadura geliboluensis TaxID=882440 RepID=UPI0036952B80
MTEDELTAAFANGPERSEGLEENLAAALQAAVPLRMLETRDWPATQRANDAAWAVELMRSGAAADELLYGVKDGRPAAAFNALVRGLAALAYAEGGVTVAGLHWCAEQHAECPTGPQWRHLPAVADG